MRCKTIAAASVAALLMASLGSAQSPRIAVEDPDIIVETPELQLGPVSGGLTTEELFERDPSVLPREFPNNGGGFGPSGSDPFYVPLDPGGEFDREFIGVDGLARAIPGDDRLQHDHEGDCAEAIGAYVNKLGGQAGVVLRCFGVGEPLPRGLDALRARTVLLGYADAPDNDCSGFLLDADTVLTALHCVSVTPRGEVAQPSGGDRAWFDAKGCLGLQVFLPDQGAARDVVDVSHLGAEMRGAACAFGSVSATVIGNDMALLQLDRPFPGVTPYELGAAPALTIDSPLVLMGRNPVDARDLPRIIVARSQICRVRVSPDQSGGALVHRCLTYGGMSGGPIFVRVGDGDYRLAAVHVDVVNSGYRQECHPAHQDICSLDDLWDRQFANVGVLIQRLALTAALGD